ncbi:MAG: BBP7 family outer membrane beta-barrel protein [Pirellulaceae bacterium]|nr:BBP7 family outer membrane beta-barrel protein [Pirellulaceae bacterium]
MRRSTADSFTLMTDQNTGQEIVNVDNLEFDHRAVPRLNLIYETACCWGIGIGFFGIDSWNTSKPGGNIVSPVLIGPGINFPNTAPGTIFRADYGSELYSLEVNFRRRVTSCVTVLAGFRWVEFGDDLATSTIAPIVEPIYSIDTNNHMYGFQIGGDAQLVTLGSFHIDSIIRAGILFNSADQNTYAPALSQIGPSVVDRISASADHTSFIGELGLRGVYDLGAGFSVIGGYQVMFLDGIALAPDQIPVTDLIAPGSAVLDTGGTLYFHGATVGLQATF